MKNPPLIFLIDDQPIANFLNKKLLETAGIKGRVEDYTEAETALHQMEERMPDLILLDLNMPRMNGWQFLEAMQEKQLKTNVVIVTSSSNDLDIQRAEIYTIVKDYMIKPLRITSVSNIQKILEPA